MNIMDMSKTAIILDKMIGRRTNHDIEIMMNRYLGKGISMSEYDYLFRRMVDNGIDADEFHVNYCLDGDAWARLQKNKKTFRKNKQKHSKGKPKMRSKRK